MRPKCVDINLVAIKTLAKTYFDFEWSEVSRERSQDHSLSQIEHAASHYYALLPGSFQKSAPHQLLNIRGSVIHWIPGTPSIKPSLPAFRLGSASKIYHNRRIKGF